MALALPALQEEMQKPLLSAEQIKCWLRQFRQGDQQNVEHRQWLVDSFINVVYLYDDKLVLIFNYKDGSKTISLKELKSSDLPPLGAIK